MQLGVIILREATQKEKNTILSLIGRLQNTNLTVKEKQTQTKRRDLWLPMVEGEGKRGIGWEFGIRRCKLMLGGIGDRRRGRSRMRWLDGITDLMDVSLSELR